MLCRKPFQFGTALAPCGQCMPCRINKRREWSHRLELEAALREDNSFVTLTYADEHLPLSSRNYPSLEPKHLRDWLKRLRSTISPLRVRYFAVGEYGERTFRPHYHAILFGFPTCRHGLTRKHLSECCAMCSLVQKTWKFGKVELGTVAPEACQYVCGYVLKKMTAADDPRLEGRHPEFARMSLKPGIGADMMHDVASVMLDPRFADQETPRSLRHGSQEKPLGRYLRRKLAEATGKEIDAEKALRDQFERLRPMHEEARRSEKSFKTVVLEAHAQAALNKVTKAKLRKKKRTL